MKRIFTISLSLLSLCLGAQNPNPDASVDADIMQEITAEKIPGLSTAIVKNGEIVWIKSYGEANNVTQTPYTDTTSQMMASVSKLFSGIAIMKLSEAGHFALDDSINAHLPFAVRAPGFENTPITFRMLVTHTASIQDSQAGDSYYNWSGDPTLTLEQTMQRFFDPTGSDYHAQDNWTGNAPGTGYNYSNMGTALQGYLVERITGTAFNTWCNTNIFDQLCMSRTRWLLSEFSDTATIANPHDKVNNVMVPISHYSFSDYPNGALKSNVTDLANFMIAMLNGGSLNSNSILQSATVDSMLKPAIPSIDTTQGLQFGSADFNSPTGTVKHWGHGGAEKGIKTELYLDRKNNIGIVVLANGAVGLGGVQDILYDYAFDINATGSNGPTCGLSVSTASISQEKINIAPNPSSGIVTVARSGEGSAQVSIFDAAGNEVAQSTISSGSTQIDLSGLANGFYTARVSSNAGATTQKIQIIK